MRAVLLSYSVPPWLFSLAPTLWAEKPDPWQSHCLPMEPKELQARSRPIAPEPKASPSQPQQKRSTRSKTRAIKNGRPKSEPTGGPSKTITQNPSRPVTQSQGHRQPPNCSPEADHPHGSRSMFFFSCSFEHGKEECPLKVHTCEPFRGENCFQNNLNTFCHGHFLDTGGSMELSRKKKSNTGPSKTIKNHVFQIWRCWTLRCVLQVVTIRINHTLQAMPTTVPATTLSHFVVKFSAHPPEAPARCRNFRMLATVPHVSRLSLHPQEGLQRAKKELTTTPSFWTVLTS